MMRMILKQAIFFIIAFCKIEAFSGELEVEVRISDMQQNPLNLSQLEETALLMVELRHNEETVYILNLRQERTVFSPNFKAYKQDKDGNPVRIPHEKINTKCYFSGYVRGFADSVVFINFCRGLMGTFHAAQEWYQVDPVKTNAVPSLTRAKLKLQKKSNVSFRCGLDTSHMTPTRRNRVKREEADMGSEYRVIELKLIISKELYESFENEDYLLGYFANLVMQANWFFHNVSFILVASEILVWSTENEIDLSSVKNSSTIIGDFVNLRILKEAHNDVSHLSEDFDAVLLNIDTKMLDAIGISYEYFICQFPLNCLVVSHKDRSLHDVVATMVHEIGHLLGLSHEDECSVDGYNIMSTYAPTEENIKFEWSSCSIDKLRTSMKSSTMYCLTRELNLVEHVCGDGIEHSEEECDIGMSPNVSIYYSKCCDSQACKLVDGAKCYKGSCCDLDTCEFKARGTVCRQGDGECDVVDVCSGTSGFCRNKYKRNGIKCSGDSNCYQGTCRTREKACLNLLPLFTLPSGDDCFSDEDWSAYNLNYLNCGIDYDGPIECEAKDRRCGKMMCDTSRSLETTRSALTIREGCTVIWEFIHPAHKNSLSYTPDGTECGENKFCISHKCVNKTLYMQMEFKKYHDANFSYDDHDIEFNLTNKLSNGGSHSRFASLSCMLFPASLLALLL